MIGWIAKLFGGGFLDRIFDTIDKKVDSETERQRIKNETVQTYIRQKANFTNGRAFWLMMLFAAPLALWFCSVVVYSVFWHQNGPFPQDWDIAALPQPLDTWAGWIITFIFGVGGYMQGRNK